MELILGLEPMSQYDAAAPAMYSLFQPVPDSEPFAVITPRVSVTEINAPTAFGAQASMKMNLDEADMAPEIELNEIIWRSVRGTDAPMPPPRRAAFITAAAAGEEREEAERDQEEAREAKAAGKKRKN
jgi:hypothetical protein